MFSACEPERRGAELPLLLRRPRRHGAGAGFCLPAHEKIREDRYFDWYEVRLETKLERIAYYFELSDGAETLCYFGDCYEMAGTPTRADYFQLPFNHRADRLSVPEWTKDAVVYNIFPDSFADGFRTLSGGSDGKTGLGGTIRGVTENLDYIASMGFNCIYLNPILWQNLTTGMTPSITTR